jgi:hypothetical protein
MYLYGIQLIKYFFMITVYALFQTDVWKTRRSRVLFGIFSSFELANIAAKEKNLYSCHDTVENVEFTINEFVEFF